MCINVLLASSVKWEFCLASAWEESPQHFAQEANVVSLTAEGWFLPKGQDLSCTLDSWCRLDHWAIKPSFPTIVPKEEWWVMFSKPYQFLTSLFLQWPLLLHSSYLNFEVLVLLNWFPGWQSLCFWSCWFSRAHLHLFHVGEYSPSAVPAEQLRGPTALSESPLSQRPPAKDLQARGLLTVLYTFFFFFFFILLPLPSCRCFLTGLVRSYSDMLFHQKRASWWWIVPISFGKDKEWWSMYKRGRCLPSLGLINEVVVVLLRQS